MILRLVLIVALCFSYAEGSCKLHHTEWLDTSAGPKISQPSRSDPTKVMLDWSNMLDDQRCVDEFVIYVWNSAQSASQARIIRIPGPTRTSAIVDVSPCVKYNFQVEFQQGSYWSSRTTRGKSGTSTYRTDGVATIKDLGKHNFEVRYLFDRQAGVHDLTKAVVSFNKTAVLNHPDCVGSLTIRSDVDAATDYTNPLSYLSNYALNQGEHGTRHGGNAVEERKGKLFGSVGGVGGAHYGGSGTGGTGGSFGGSSGQTGGTGGAHHGGSGTGGTGGSFGGSRGQTGGAFGGSSTSSAGGTGGSFNGVGGTGGSYGGNVGQSGSQFGGSPVNWTEEIGGMFNDLNVREIGGTFDINRLQFPSSLLDRILRAQGVNLPPPPIDTNNHSRGKRQDSNGFNSVGETGGAFNTRNSGRFGYPNGNRYNDGNPNHIYPDNYNGDGRHYLNDGHGHSQVGDNYYDTNPFHVHPDNNYGQVNHVHPDNTYHNHDGYHSNPSYSGTGNGGYTSSPYGNDPQYDNGFWSQNGLGRNPDRRPDYSNRGGSVQDGWFAGDGNRGKRSARRNSFGASGGLLNSNQAQGSSGGHSRPSSNSYGNGVYGDHGNYGRGSSGTSMNNDGQSGGFNDYYSGSSGSSFNSRGQGSWNDNFYNGDESRPGYGNGNGGSGYGQGSLGGTMNNGRRTSIYDDGSDSSRRLDREQRRNYDYSEGDQYGSGHGGRGKRSTMFRPNKQQGVAKPPFDDIARIVLDVRACQPYMFSLKVRNQQEKVIGNVPYLVLPPIELQNNLEIPDLVKVFETRKKLDNMCFQSYLTAVNNQILRNDDKLAWYHQQSNRLEDLSQRPCQTGGSHARPPFGLPGTTSHISQNKKLQLLKMSGCGCHMSSFIRLNTTDEKALRSYPNAFGLYEVSDRLHAGRPYYEKRISNVESYYVYYDDANSMWYVDNTMGDDNPKLYMDDTGSSARCPADSDVRGRGGNWYYSGKLSWNKFENFKITCGVL